MDTVRTTHPAPREWLELRYHDPVRILLGLRRLDHAISRTDTPVTVRRLRTNALKPYREGRQAALFCLGLSRRLGRPIRFALQKPLDDAADAIGLVDDQGNAVFLPIQLKELPPHYANATLSLQDLLTSVGKKFAGTGDTILAIHINRRAQIVISDLNLPTNFAEIWLFGSSDETQDKWFLIGDLLTAGGLTSEFTHPGPKLLHRFCWPHQPGNGAYTYRTPTGR